MLLAACEGVSHAHVYRPGFLSALAKPCWPDLIFKIWILTKLGAKGQNSTKVAPAQEPNTKCLSSWRTGKLYFKTLR